MGNEIISRKALIVSDRRGDDNPAMRDAVRRLAPFCSLFFFFFFKIMITVTAPAASAMSRKVTPTIKPAFPFF